MTQTGQPAGRHPRTSPQDWWATGVTQIEPGVIRYRGYPVQEVIRQGDFAQTIWLLVRGELPTPDQVRLFEKALVAGLDHGPQAPSMAVARMAATCGVGINNAVASAINLLGDVHGGAGQQFIEVLNALHDQVEAGRTPAEAARQYVEAVRSEGARVPGFGHRFHPRDPRRDPLVEAVEAARDRGAVSGDYLALGLAVEAALAEGRSRPVPMNIDGATAIVYAELGFAPELGRGLFVLARSVGALAHAWEESGSGLRNKGPIPRHLLPTWTGAPERHLPTPGSADA